MISEKGRQTVGEGTDSFAVAEGDIVYIPTNVLHSTYNTTWSPLRLMVIYTPGGAEKVLDSLPGSTRVLQPGEAPVWAQVV